MVAPFLAAVWGSTAAIRTRTDGTIDAGQRRQRLLSIRREGRNCGSCERFVGVISSYTIG